MQVADQLAIIALVEDETLTLQETADRLGVHYMTAYRWVRTGLLPAVKDNGVWRVRVADADARATPEAIDETSTRPRRRVDHGARLADRLLAGDEGGATKVVDDALAGGVSPEDLCLEVITDAMRRVGDAWADGEASIAQEHQASVVTGRLIGRLAPQFTRRGRKRGAIVLGAVAGDEHGLPVALLAGPLRGRGHRVVELGANTPPDAFAEAVRDASPVAAVGIFCSRAVEDIVRETVAAVRRADPAATVVVGGAGIADADRATALGADHFSPDGHAAVEAMTDGRD